MKSKPDGTPIAVSCGDLNGIGPEVFIQAANQTTCPVHFHFFGPDGFQDDSSSGFKSLMKNGLLTFHPAGSGYPFTPEPGVFSSVAGKIALDAFTSSVRYCQKHPGTGLLTLPINKKSFVSAGSPFSGHTELLGSLTGEPEPLMILMNDWMKVALLTVHIPLHRVSGAITIDRITDRCIRMADSLKKDFLISNPALAVLSLNPHAGDGGTIGQEEESVFVPAIRKLNEEGYSVSGPFASDGFFGSGMHRKFDGILASYHDQGLIPVKLSGMDSGVNFSAGNRIVRTSPDHGTAYDIAGKGLANPSSTRQAIDWLVRILRNRSQENQ